MRHVDSNRDMMRQIDIGMNFERLQKEERRERRITGKRRPKQAKKQAILAISEHEDAKLLDKDGVTVSSMDPDLYRATIEGDILEFVKSMEQGPKDRHGVPAVSCMQVTPQKNTVLHLATLFGHDEIVKLICKDLPFLIMERNCRGDTALHIAARAGNSLLVNLLLVSSTKGFVGVKNDTGNTALHEALQHHHEDVAWNIINKDRNMLCSVNNEGKSLLYLAAEAGYASIVKFLMENPGGNYITVGKLENRPSIKAAIFGKNIDVLKIMWERDQSSFNLRCKKGRNPLHYAASIGFIEGVNFLLDKFCDAAYQGDKNGLSPIHMAAIKGHFHIIQKMLWHCPDLMEILTSKGQNILHVAAKSGRVKAVSFMLRKVPMLEKLINDKDEDGNTPLHLAAIYEHPKVVITLASDKRVNLKVENNERMTALDIADDYMETMASFRKRLTWMALKVSGAPKSPHPNVLKSKVQIFTQEHPKLENCKEKVNIILLVATLVVAVTYAAGFTIPGGYNNSAPDEGMATMLPKEKFHAFLICDSIAMYSSTMVAVTLIWAQLGDVSSVLVALKIALPVLWLALAMMSIAFMAGVCIVVSKLSWLADIVMLISLIFLATLVILFIPLCPLPSSCSLIFRHPSYYLFLLMIIVFGSYMDYDMEE